MKDVATKLVRFEEYNSYTKVGTSHYNRGPPARSIACRHEDVTRRLPASDCRDHIKSFRKSRFIGCYIDAMKLTLPKTGQIYTESNNQKLTTSNTHTHQAQPT